MDMMKILWVVILLAAGYYIGTHYKLGLPLLG